MPVYGYIMSVIFHCSKGVKDDPLLRTTKPSLNLDNAFHSILRLVMHNAYLYNFLPDFIGIGSRFITTAILDLSAASFLSNTLYHLDVPAKEISEIACYSQSRANTSHCQSRYRSGLRF